MKILEIIVSPESFLLTSLKNISSPQINYNIRHYSFILEVLKKNIHIKWEGKALVINFNKKRRRISLVLLLVLFFAGTMYWSNNYVENDAMKIVNSKNINNYIIDAVFDDKDKKIKCNQNITYVNNTGKTLDKIYMHIYPNAFMNKKFSPFEKGI